jgi:hypothetical protein
LLALRGIDQHNPIALVAWDSLKQVAYQVTLWVEDADSDPGLDVLERQIQQQCALAAAGRSEDVHVVSAVRLGDSSGFPGRALQAAEDAAIRRQRPVWTKPDPGRIHRNCGNRQVEELGQLFSDEVQPASWRATFSNRAVEPGSPPNPLGPEAVFAIQCAIG